MLRKKSTASIIKIQREYMLVTIQSEKSTSTQFNNTMRVENFVICKRQRLLTMINRFTMCKELVDR
jgi:hypothetical protein